MARSRRKRTERIQSKMTPTGVRLDTFEVARANRVAQIELPTLLGNGVSQKAYANPGIQAPVTVALDPVTPQQNPKKMTEPVKNEEKKPVFEEKRLCKARPKKTKGNGSSRPFVKWCN